MMKHMHECMLISFAKKVFPDKKLTYNFVLSENQNKQFAYAKLARIYSFCNIQPPTFL